MTLSRKERRKRDHWGLVPVPNGTAASISVLPDGNILVGRTFSTSGGASRACLARLNADGRNVFSFNFLADSNPSGLMRAKAHDFKVIYKGGTKDVTRAVIVGTDQPGVLEPGGPFLMLILIAIPNK